MIIQGYNSSLTMLGGRSVNDKNEETTNQISNKNNPSNENDLDDEIPF